jgi:hypothetical protein
MTTTLTTVDVDAPRAPLDRDGARARKTHGASQPLRTILRANAAFSLACGSVAVVAAERLADWIGTDLVWLVRLVGIGLIAYSPLLVAVAASRADRLITFSLLVSLADFGWVAGTIALLATGVVADAGVWMLGLTGLIVLTFGIGQLLARRSLTRSLR